MSQRIVLDTHIWLWYINGNFDKFPKHWHEQIKNADLIGVSSVSCYEIVLAHSKGRLELNIPVKQWLIDALQPSGIELLPLNPEISFKAVNLSIIHKDPFDRIIIATTLEYKAKLASIDSLFCKYPELQDNLMTN